MGDRLADHEPSRLAQHRAAAAGLDLADLKRNDPVRYMILNAEEILRVDKDLGASGRW